MEKIKKHSRYIRIIGQIAFWLSILAGIAALIVIWVGPTEHINLKINNVEYEIDQLQTNHRITLTLTVILVVTVIAYGLRHFYKLFKLYEQGEIFGEDNVRHFSAIGKAMLMWFLAKVFSSIAMDQLAEFAESSVTINLNLSSLIIGVAIILISRVMDEGRKIREEQELTI